MSTSYRNLSADHAKDVSTSGIAASMAHKHLDYKGRNGGSLAAHFIFECAIKLNMKPLTSATAAVIYHRFFREVDSEAYDEFVCVEICILLAGESRRFLEPKFQFLCSR